jgi:Zn-dependent peptidase ImmA (M78 family)
LGDLPIENLTQTAEENGVVIIAWNRDEGQFDGLSGWCNGDIPVTVVNMGVDVDRRRFNLGHELGHLLMQTAEEQSESLAHRR